MIREVKRLPKREQMAQGMSPGTRKGAPKVHDRHWPQVKLTNFSMAWAPLSIIDAKKPEPKELRDWSSGSVTPLGTANKKNLENRFGRKT